MRISRAAADPAVVPAAAAPGGWSPLAYYRLHGSPRMYYSEYDTAYLRKLSELLARSRQDGCATWVIFDNTARGAAFLNALTLRDHVGG